MCPGDTLCSQKILETMNSTNTQHFQKNLHVFLTGNLMILGLAALLILSLTANAAVPTCYNIGTLGAAGNGTHTGNVLVYKPGAVAVGPDYSSYYDGTGPHTTIPWQSALNPASGSPFTVEFWAKPEASDNDDCPLFNRVSSGNRSGWAFFQRAPGTGWNWRMYDGNGGNLGFDLTGGTATLDAWSHVVGVWDGTTAKLYVNGVDTGAANGGSGVYNASTTATWSVGAYDVGATASTGYLDDIAFYGTALSAAKILAHYNAASSLAPDAYSALVRADGARLYLDQNPPSVRIARAGSTQTVTFTGMLSQSSDLTAPFWTTSWPDLAVSSPYSVPGPLSPLGGFRSHRYARRQQRVQVRIF